MVCLDVRFQKSHFQYVSPVLSVLWHDALEIGVQTTGGFGPDNVATIDLSCFVIVYQKGGLHLAKCIHLETRCKFHMKVL